MGANYEHRGAESMPNLIRLRNPKQCLVVSTIHRVIHRGGRLPKFFETSTVVRGAGQTLTFSTISYYGNHVRYQRVT